MPLYVSWQYADAIGPITVIKLEGLAIGMGEDVILPDVFSGPILVHFGDEKAQISPESQTINFSQNLSINVFILSFSAEQLAPSPQYVSESVQAFANSAQGLALIYDTPLELVEAVAHALAVFLTIDKTVWLLARLATEKHPRLHPFVRGLCRAYLPIEETFNPILAEISLLNLNTQTLADETSFASLTVRVLTASVDLVTSFMPQMILSTLSERIPQPTDTGRWMERMPSADGGRWMETDGLRDHTALGTMLCLSVVTCAFCFSDVAPNAATLRVYRVVMQALSGEESFSNESALIRGLSADLRSKAPFSSLLSNRSIFLVQPDPTDSAVAVLGNLMPKERPKSLAELVETFKQVAFARESTPQHQLHYFHQYHLHDHSDVINR